MATRTKKREEKNENIKLDSIEMHSNVATKVLRKKMQRKKTIENTKKKLVV